MDKEQAKTRIRQAYPELTIETMEILGKGFDSEAFLINQSYVFKFPRHARAARNLYKEVVVFKEINDKLPLKVPEICFIGKAEKPNQLDFVGQEKIKGVPLDAKILTTLTEEQKNEIAKELAAFFKTLHEIELSVSLEGLEVDKNAKAAYEYEVIQQAAYPLLKKSVQQEIDEVYKESCNRISTKKNVSFTMILVLVMFIMIKRQTPFAA